MTRKQLIARVQSVILQNDLNLQKAVAVLGGPSSVMRLQRFRHALAMKHTSDIKLRREVNWIYELLSLKYVDNPDFDEAALFSAIDPNDPIVWVICGLTEAFGDLVLSLEGLPSELNSDSGEVAA